MSAPQPTEPDGNLPTARRDLDNAIHQLIEPRSTIHNNQIVTAPSLYMQLWDAVSGENNNGGGAGGGTKSRPPFWTDAFDKCNEIDQTVEAWQPAYTGVPPTVGRLKWLQDRKWRPQDVHSINQITAAVQAWAVEINELMNPTPKWTLPYPCPNCDTKHVYRRDTTGELVRQPALHVSPEDGCRCARCHAHWPPGRLLFLGRLLDSVPDNVLD